MKLKVILYKPEEGGFWAEAAAISEFVSQGETEDVIKTVREAIEGCLNVEVK